MQRSGGKWQKHGPGMLNAWVADMDFDPAPVILARLRAMLDGGDLGYPDWSQGNGMDALFAERMRTRFGWSPDPARCVQFDDVVQGLQVVLRYATSAGDGVAYHVPSYPPFHSSFESAALEEHRLAAHLTPEGWWWRPDDLLRAVRAGARVLLLCNPHNPTGRCFTAAELSEMAQVACDHDLLVISDEIHADLVYHPNRHIPIASLGSDIAARTVTLTAASKAFNLAGLRWAIAHVGVEELAERLQSQPNHLFGTPNIMGVEAARSAWTEADDWLTAVLARLDANRAVVGHLLAEHLPGVAYHPPEATYLAWLDFRALGLGAEPHEVAAERGVVLSPGTDFGSLGHGWARLNMATAPNVLEAIVRRLAGS